ncbi:hypothetical protein SERLADRAFT_372095 [Serpula lacrymans var. lacrymans S7.9]|uniref:Uncharacterized protein n=1 Tax=Serpula lacrymans var. lacrymans (strain S7.9) TaxID=578457 RepID=F8P4A0_SERL9|nr:uncharacterized protein SERLADRAFT_372095 [Serpula lacrymans var. lacrymans S7.9]XP_007324907.1 uncharacterized protein SERLADRAFT_375187 [Serpula lacrymans var. lacrymans S7.9]EGO18364.1 hypothetical protein SERLADRAFT_375187 [Serpula lacrymans var. lacrymans S7.9]EGO21438.1 hypothetical protein SERLADRAFT_372095 [Serpula lacrymans var. lacrymans S7.9]
MFNPILGVNFRYSHLSLNVTKNFHLVTALQSPCVFQDNGKRRRKEVEFRDG